MSRSARWPIQGRENARADRHGEDISKALGAAPVNLPGRAQVSRRGAGRLEAIRKAQRHGKKVYESQTAFMRRFDLKRVSE